MSTLEPTIDPRSTVSLDEAAHAHPGGSRPPGAAGVVTDVLTSSDHKIGARDLTGAALVGLLAAIVCAALLAIDRISGDSPVFRDDVIPRFLNGHRVGLVFGGIAPLLLAICAFAVPLQVGARALAFARLAVLGGWTWFGGLVLFAVAVIGNGGGGGSEPRMVWLSISALALMAIGLVLGAVSIATTVLASRAPGMRLSRVPFFSWSALAYSLVIALALPVFVAVTIYVYIGNRYDTGIMSETTDVMRRAWYLFTGPSLALFAIPAVGFVAEVAGPTLRKRIAQRPVALVGIALVAIGGLSAVMQQRTIRLPDTITDITGSNFGTKFAYLAVWAIFTLLPLLGVLAVLGAVALTAKPDKAPAAAESADAPATSRSAPSPAALFALFGLLLVALGLAGNAVGGIVDAGLIGTVFEEGATAALVYGALLSALGAIVWWLPKLTGRSVSGPAAAGLALLGAAGAALAAIPHLVAGFFEQPAVALFIDTPQANAATDLQLLSTRWANDGPGELLNLLVAIGHITVAVTVAGTLLLALRALAGGGNAVGADAWGAGQTLEWSTPSPAPADNFVAAPIVTSSEPLLDASDVDTTPALEEAK